MYVKSLSLYNVKSFDMLENLEFSKKINVLIGNNNSGKSTILRALYSLQTNNMPTFYRRAKQDTCIMEIDLSPPYEKFIQDIHQDHMPFVRYEIINNSSNQIVKSRNTSNRGILNIANMYPDNFIFPFFTERKVVQYAENVTSAATKQITGNFTNLYAKIDSITNDSHPAYGSFKDECIKILGCRIGAFNSEGGKKAALRVDDNTIIPIDTMGDGVPNILGLLYDLCVAENKLFLIEEPENDLHPKALKRLLELIIKKSENNQFVITTHSNIVLQYLGSLADECKIFKTSISYGDDKIPLSEVKELKNESEDRIQILRELGYDLIDFDIWEAFLLLEESSAERIIRDILIPQFVPSLKNKLRTIGAKGIDDVEARFIDFYRLFVFVHLQPQYKEKAWVFVDGDEIGKKTIGNLKRSFSTWPKEHFLTFEKTRFEDYYPLHFKENVEKTFLIEDKDKLREAKKTLLNDVVKWADENRDAAKKAFEESAKEVIGRLKEIETTLNAANKA